MCNRLLCFLVRGVLAATLAEFAEFKPLLQGFLILVRTVAHGFANRALKFDHIVLGHSAVMLAKAKG